MHEFVSVFFYCRWFGGVADANWLSEFFFPTQNERDGAITAAITKNIDTTQQSICNRL